MTGPSGYLWAIRFRPLMLRRSPRLDPSLVCLLAAFLAPEARAQAAPLVLDPGTAAVFQRLAPAVLRLEVQESQSKAKVSVGSGFYATPNGRIVTNYHVVSRLVHEPARHVVRTTIDGELRDLTLLAIDAVNDLAILGGGSLTPQAVLAPAPLSLAKGTRVLALGHPRDLGLSVVEGTHNGAVQHAAVPRLHYTGPINPGMSGGPAVTEAGELVGVNVATFGEEVAFLVPSDPVAALLERAPGAPPPAQQLRADIANQLGELAKARLTALFASDGPTAVLDGFRVPTGSDTTFRCWGDTERPADKRYEVLRHSCDTDGTTLISETLRAGLARFEHAVVRGALSPLRLLTALEEVYNNQTPFDGTAREVTSFRCRDANVRATKLAWRTRLCVRRFRHMPDTYEAMLRAVAPGPGRSGMITSLLLSGVPFELIDSLAPRYLAAIEVAQ
jgi:serine protease Do